ncbi:MAG: KEOPS complex subunit Pcc1 [Methanothrix sp.]|jgi:KEOPS complex subunit Pcc1|nr:KEOPS complex subunit Pcc1 [Methanothrix sp.]OPX79707.1 MAG: Transcription factor Pcc1 [Methanosaeta sp. PtaB.Bin087]NLX38378.1 hypothetical protein [Methanothrix sp.]HNR57929.1 KEOPS complex subunit Pcc1 [Methanothrix sp.]HNT71529.1 KEOPS complex subunit Pcc1 [Methanothrix sp.]
MRGSAEIAFEVEGPCGILAALAPEAEDQVQRSLVRLEAWEGGILLKVEGEDLVSLRAALNTWIRLVDIAIKMVKV